jgi:hypothetical protein
MNIHQLLQKNNHENILITINETTISEGIVFIYPSWSSDFIYLKTLLDCLKNSPVSPNLHILDIDNESCRFFEQKHGVLNHGKGEMYLIKNGEILSQILQHIENTEVVMNEMINFEMGK